MGDGSHAGSPLRPRAVARAVEEGLIEPSPIGTCSADSPTGLVVGMAPARLTEDGVEIPRGAFFQPPGSTDSVRELDLVELGPARGGRKPRKKAVMWEVLRSLRMPEDLPLLSQSLPSPKQTLSQIRHSHHQLARLVAAGRANSDAALLTGYSPTYISILKDDPSFGELVAHYSMQEELAHVDVLERMRLLGLSTLDELQNRLEEDPNGFSNRELMEQADLMLVKPMVATRGGIPIGATSSSTPAGGVSVNVNFITSPAKDSGHPSASGDSSPGPIIDVKAEDITPGGITPGGGPRR